MYRTALILDTFKISSLLHRDKSHVRIHKIIKYKKQQKQNFKKPTCFKNLVWKLEPVTFPIWYFCNKYCSTSQHQFPSSQVSALHWLAYILQNYRPYKYKSILSQWPLTHIDVHIDTSTLVLYYMFEKNT